MTAYYLFVGLGLSCEPQAASRRCPEMTWYARLHYLSGFSAFQLAMVSWLAWFSARAGESGASDCFFFGTLVNAKVFDGFASVS